MNLVLPGGLWPGDDEFEELVPVEGPLGEERHREDGVAVVQPQGLVQKVDLVLERPVMEKGCQI